MGKRRDPRQPKIDIPIAVGDIVLVGGTRASYPGEWYIGGVLWSGRGDVLLERSTPNGETWRQLISALEIRAIGDISSLVAIQTRAREAVDALQKNVRQCESALGDARVALFSQLERLAADGLKVIPPNFDAIEAARAYDRKLVEQCEAKASGAL